MNDSFDNSKDDKAILAKLTGKFIRICQECGHKQEDKDPEGNPTNAFLNRKCKKCKSEALDYGSFHP